MKRFASISKHNDIAVITVDNPPVNALGPGVAEDIHDAIVRAAADPDVLALILTGSGRTFIAGGDIRHLEEPKSHVGQIWREEMERLDKPVLAAIHGYALGGGLEAALCCHYRIATRSARLGLPEVRIGIVPGGGGTQRLPRLIGVRAALDLIVSGRHITADEAKQIGLLDAIVEDDNLGGAALRFARDIAAKRPIPRTGEMGDKLGDRAANAAIFTDIHRQIAARAGNQLAPHYCIACVEAAVDLPLQEGLAREQALFNDLCRSEESRALKHVFWSERRCSSGANAQGTMPVASNTSGGVIATRSRAPFIAEMVALIEQGAVPEKIDEVMLDFGFSAGPFAAWKVVGLDIARPTGRTCATLDGCVSNEEMRDRLLLAAVNEAARMIEEGIARSASDIDVVWINGFGFPRYRGGLMYWAEHELSWPRVVDMLNVWHIHLGA